jgi:DNA integrity scanning protein DisA with diadenylate cyclase activity
MHCNSYKWDEGYIDYVLNDLMKTTQKFGDLIVSMTDRDDNIDESVDNLSKLLVDIFVPLINITMHMCKLYSYTDVSQRINSCLNFYM